MSTKMNKRNEMLGEAYQCGVYAARIFSEPRGAPLRRLHYADEAHDRAQELADILGPEAADSFYDGFGAILAPPERGPCPCPKCRKAK